MNFEGAIFDVDGTILNSMEIWEEAGRMYLESKNIRISTIQRYEEIRGNFRTMTIGEAARYCRETFGIEDSQEKIVDDINNVVEEYYFFKAKPKNNVIEFLDCLQNMGIPMTVATATDRYLVEKALKNNKMHDYFKGIYTCSEVGLGKSSPEIYLRAAEHMRTEPEKTVVFEDVIYAGAEIGRASCREECRSRWSPYH